MFKAGHLTHPEYRADIDGLRAIAILSVISFHAFPLQVRGGFIGVDIFFVISGFLISTIIFGSLERNRFSFVEFYIRRIKRIFPALVLVLAASFVFGWFTLFGDEYKQLGKQIAGGAGFISNFLFWHESGYFDRAAETKPLLHLWSLGVEEQYYIIWPVLLWAVWKLRLNFLAITITVAAISFALNIVYMRNDAVAAFYLPQARFWELMMGSVLAYFSLHRKNLPTPLKVSVDKLICLTADFRAAGMPADLLLHIWSLSGAVLIAIGILVITKDQGFPGWWALLPTLGAVMIISAGPRALPNRMLSNRVLVWFGLISYPLYLWHWSVLSFTHIIESEELSNALRIFSILISILLAWLTYGLVEKPVRFGKHGKIKTVILIVLMFSVGYAGYDCYTRDGLGFRFKDRQEYSDYFDNTFPEFRYGRKMGLFEKYRLECGFADIEKYLRTGKETPIPRKQISQECYKRDPKYAKAVFIWGDSHAQHLYYGLKNNLPADWQILQVASTGCAADIHAKGPSTTDQCVQSNWFAIKTIKNTKPDVVIVAQNLGQNIMQFRNIAANLKAWGVKKIIFTGPTPHWTANLPKIIVRKLWLLTPQRTYVGINKKVLLANALLQEEFQRTDTEIYANLIDLFCNKDGCLTYIGEDKKNGLITWDQAHLTPVGSDYLAKNLLVHLITDPAPQTP